MPHTEGALILRLCSTRLLVAPDSVKTLHARSALVFGRRSFRAVGSSAHIKEEERTTEKGAREVRELPQEGQGWLPQVPRLARAAADGR